MSSSTPRPAKTSMAVNVPSTLEVCTAKSYSNKFFNTMKRGSTQSFDIGAKTTMSVKPRILESKVSENSDFYNLSDGFKRIFADDRKDKKIIVPVVGYGGHRRGDRSQNYFGKSFRETTIQSKCLERNLQSQPHAN